MPKLPTVTQVLKPYADFSMVTPLTLEMAAARGTRVHAACAAYALGTFAPQLPKDEQGYLDSFKGWFDRAVDKVIWVEKELVDERLGFKGHPDKLIRFKGDDSLALIDLKTPAAKQKAWQAQLAAYWHLCETNGFTPVTRCGSLRLKADGGPPIFDEYTALAHDLNAFIHALQAWKYFNE